MTPTDQPTPAELRALRAYLAGGSMKAAGHRLGCSPRTVAVHIANVRSKVGAKTTAEAVLKLHDRLAA